MKISLWRYGCAPTHDLKWVQFPLWHNGEHVEWSLVDKLMKFYGDDVEIDRANCEHVNESMDNFSPMMFEWSLVRVLFNHHISSIPLARGSLGHYRWFHNQFPPFFCSSLPSGTWRTPGMSIPWWCLPTSASVCLVFFPLSLCLARWFWPDLMNGRHVHTTAICVSLRWSGGLSCGPIACWILASSCHGLYKET